MEIQVRFQKFSTAGFFDFDGNFIGSTTQKKGQ
jgi:hypothetical protein